MIEKTELQNDLRHPAADCEKSSPSRIGNNLLFPQE